MASVDHTSVSMPWLVYVSCVMHHCLHQEYVYGTTSTMMLGVLECSHRHRVYSPKNQFRYSFRRPVSKLSYSRPLGDISISLTLHFLRNTYVRIFANRLYQIQVNLTLIYNQLQHKRLPGSQILCQESMLKIFDGCKLNSPLLTTLCETINVQFISQGNEMCLYYIIQKTFPRRIKLAVMYQHFQNTILHRNTFIRKNIWHHIIKNILKSRKRLNLSCLLQKMWENARGMLKQCSSKLSRRTDKLSTEKGVCLKGGYFLSFCGKCKINMFLGFDLYIPKYIAWKIIVSVDGKIELKFFEVDALYSGMDCREMYAHVIDYGHVFHNRPASNFAYTTHGPICGRFPDVKILSSSNVVDVVLRHHIDDTYYIPVKFSFAYHFVQLKIIDTVLHDLQRNSVNVHFCPRCLQRATNNHVQYLWSKRTFEGWKLTLMMDIMCFSFESLNLDVTDVPPISFNFGAITQFTNTLFHAQIKISTLQVLSKIMNTQTSFVCVSLCCLLQNRKGIIRLNLQIRPTVAIKTAPVYTVSNMNQFIKFKIDFPKRNLINDKLYIYNIVLNGLAVIH